MSLKNLQFCALQCSEMQWRLLKGLIVNVNGAVLSLRRFLAFETPLKTMKNDLNFTLKAHFVLKIYKFLS